VPLQKRIVSNGVEIDFCDWHGLWLDAGELERLVASQTGNHTPSQPGVGKAVVQGLAGAAVMGAGFHLGGRVVGGILDALFRGKV
jgi:hypothetical protein